MFRFVVAVGCARLVAGRRVMESGHDELQQDKAESGTWCPSAYGFTASAGKCTGQFVENWADGKYANYGQDANGHIGGLSDAAQTCSQHPDCSGFYTREGVGYSHWRTGHFDVQSGHPGHCCYQKVGGYSPTPAPYRPPAPPSRSEQCPSAYGFTAYAGKCTGQFVENWADGEYAYYGQDGNAGIYDVYSAAQRCQQHYDCSGFYTREGVGYSHWRTGHFDVQSGISGHCCYRKTGGSLLEVSESGHADAEDSLAKHDEAQSQYCAAGRTCPTFDHCHPVSYGSFGCGFQCTRQGGHGSYLCNNHCAGCNYVSLLELSPSLLDLSASSEDADAEDSLATEGAWCPAVSGFSANPGKCMGQYVENWADGEYAYYGQDGSAGISDVYGAAWRCSQHSDCSGFYTREGVGYSHWRTGHIYIRPEAGHCCYQKLGGSTPAPPAPTPRRPAWQAPPAPTPRRPAWQERTASGLLLHSEGCYQIQDSATCIGAADGRRDYQQSPCAWCCGDACDPSGFKCQPRQWLLDQPQHTNFWVDGEGRGSCSWSPTPPYPAPPTPPAPSPTSSHTCSDVSGFSATPGKCMGDQVYTWADGEYANYGQDRNARIYGVYDAASRCSRHSDCSGFYSREGVGYSHWRTGHIYIHPEPGHCCYQKI